MGHFGKHINTAYILIQKECLHWYGCLNVLYSVYLELEIIGIDNG